MSALSFFRAANLRAYGDDMFVKVFSIISNFFYLMLGIGGQKSFPPPLEAEKERQYFKAMENGDTQAREQLILHNLRLVSHIVRKYYASAKNQEDLVSIGTLGLIKAVDTFKVSNGARFATYAARCIQNEILMHFRANKKLAAEVSVNDTIDIDRDGNPLTYIDVISCDEDIPLEIGRKISAEKAMRLVDTVLDERERRIIVMRYGLGGTAPLTQKQVAEAMKISRSYVSRIEKSALEKLASAMGV